jgi:hypothetical protein
MDPAEGSALVCTGLMRNRSGLEFFHCVGL